MATSPPTFSNATSSDVVLGTWVAVTPGLNEHRDTRVVAGGEVPLPASSTGEYFVRDRWYSVLAKFRLTPAADGRCAWAYGDGHVHVQKPAHGVHTETYTYCACPQGETHATR